MSTNILVTILPKIKLHKLNNSIILFINVFMCFLYYNFYYFFHYILHFSLGADVQRARIIVHCKVYINHYHILIFTYYSKFTKLILSQFSKISTHTYRHTNIYALHISHEYWSIEKNRINWYFNFFPNMTSRQLLSERICRDKIVHCRVLHDIYREFWHWFSQIEDHTRNSWFANLYITDVMWCYVFLNIKLLNYMQCMYFSIVLKHIMSDK